MKYIDTNVFIYAIENHPKYGKACAKVLFDIENEKLKAAASILVLVEIINVLSKINRVLKKTKQIPLDISQNTDSVLSLPIMWFDLDFFTIRKASSYSFPISVMDYFHVSAMEINSISEILSADKEFEKVGFIKRVDPLDY